MPEGAFFGFLRLAAIPAVSREPERKRALDDLSAVIDGGVRIGGGGSPAAAARPPRRGDDDDGAGQRRGVACRIARRDRDGVGAGVGVRRGDGGAGRLRAVAEVPRDGGGRDRVARGGGHLDHRADGDGRRHRDRADHGRSGVALGGEDSLVRDARSDRWRPRRRWCGRPPRWRRRRGRTRLRSSRLCGRGRRRSPRARRSRHRAPGTPPAPGRRCCPDQSCSSGSGRPARCRRARRRDRRGAGSRCAASRRTGGAGAPPAGTVTENTA